MSIETSSTQLIKRLNMTESEVDVANRAATLIRRYRLESRGVWSELTADELVRAEVGDPSRQLCVLAVACAVEKETRPAPSARDDSTD